MPLIPDAEREFVDILLEENLKNDVTIAVFTQPNGCLYGMETVNLIRETASLSPKIKVEVYHFPEDIEKFREHGIERIPAVMVLGGGRLGSNIRFYGIPSGQMYRALVDDIIFISSGFTGLQEGTKVRIKKIAKPVHIIVLVNLKCPQCLIMARLAHQSAMENPNIRADVIDVDEYPQDGVKYEVAVIPKIIINEKIKFSGAATEEHFIDYIFMALR